MSFRDASVVLSGRTIWSDSTFDVPAGGLVAVIGANGAGKTTMLKVLLGLVPLSAGTVSVCGRPPGSINDQIGYVPQDYDLNAGAAVRARDAVMLGLNGHRWGWSRRRADDRVAVDEALRAVEATAFAERRLSELSGGQRQRIALAGALVSRPRLLVLDEPLASLDLRNQHEIVALLARLRRDLGVTILVVAHDLNPLLDVLDSAVYLLDGHAHHAEINRVIDSDLLTHMYGTPIRVAHTLQGELYMRGT